MEILRTQLSVRPEQDAKDPGVPHWDESFVVLAMWASMEAIFLSTFVLISQTRMPAADKRADLDLQMSLLAEHEITKPITLVSAMDYRMGVRTEVDHELDEITQDVAPEAVLATRSPTDLIRRALLIPSPTQPKRHLDGFYLGR